MAIDFSLSPELEDIRARVRALVDEVVRPIEQRWDRNDRKQLIDGIIEMRKAAQERGLWLPHMPKEW
ncbi:MAG TPA: acyl-CoA dehydrogenase family protein, partial [Acidimicrobiia bacterium]|nr:acyl-CoA dehydrogenase family protein [Acidimicrobiia bacterium]